MDNFPAETSCLRDLNIGLDVYGSTFYEGFANDLTKKDIEDIAKSSEVNNQVKFRKDESDFCHFIDRESNIEEDINRNEDRQCETPNNSRTPEIVLGNGDHTNSLALNRNRSLVEGMNNNINEQVETSEGSSNIEEEIIPESGVYLIKAIAFLFSSALFSFWSILAIELNWEFLSIFGVTAVYPIIYVLIDLCWTCRLLKDLWMETGDHFKMFDALGLLFALFIILLKLVQVIPLSTVASLSFFLTALVYFFSPKKKISLILIRWFYTLQCLLITLKLDEQINFKWEFVLIPSWIYFACLIINCSQSLFYLIKRIFFNDSSSQNRRNITSSQKCGIIWFSCYYGLSIVCLIYLIGTVQALNSGTCSQLLRVMTYLVFGINVTLGICAFLKVEKLLTFIVCYQLIESHLARDYTEDLSLTRTVSLQREMRITYFVKLSSTYFKPLHSHTFTKGEHRSAQISRSKANISYSHRSLKPYTFEVNDLTEEKIELDNGINNIKLNLNGMDKLNKKTRPELFCKRVTKRLRASSIDNHIKSKQVKEKLKDKEQNTTVIKIKEFIQEESDKDELKMLNDPVSMPRAGAGAGAGEEEKTCYLCYENPADAILISCGHGGICYECASNLVKKTNKCMQCRGSVGAIYKIDPNPILGDIIKGLEFTKVELSLA